MQLLGTMKEHFASSKVDSVWGVLSVLIFDALSKAEDAEWKDELSVSCVFFVSFNSFSYSVEKFTELFSSFENSSLFQSFLGFLGRCATDQIYKIYMLCQVPVLPLSTL